MERDKIWEWLMIMDDTDALLKMAMEIIEREWEKGTLPDDVRGILKPMSDHEDWELAYNCMMLGFNKGCRHMHERWLDWTKDDGQEN